jgi:hypothetical protein
MTTPCSINPLVGSQKRMPVERLEGMVADREPPPDEEEDVPLPVLAADTEAAIAKLRAEAGAAAEAGAPRRDFCAFAARISRERLRPSPRQSLCTSQRCSSIHVPSRSTRARGARREGCAGPRRRVVIAPQYPIGTPGPSDPAAIT